MSEREHTPEEIVEKQKERTLSDAELIKGGAEYVMNKGAKEPRLEVTREQLSEKGQEMKEDLNMRDHLIKARFQAEIKNAGKTPGFLRILGWGGEKGKR